MAPKAAPDWTWKEPEKKAPKRSPYNNEPQTHQEWINEYRRKQEEKEKAEKKAEQEALRKAAAPLMRPNRPQQKKPGKPRAFPKPKLADSSSVPSPPTALHKQPQSKTKFEDWVNDENDDYEYVAVGGNRKRRKKEKLKQVWDPRGMGRYIDADWDKRYDPEKPLDYAAWKLCKQNGTVSTAPAHARFRKLLGHVRSESEERSEEDDAPRRPKQPAVQPRNFNAFAPPTHYDDDPTSTLLASSSSKMNIDTPSAGIQDEASGEDAYQRRLRMSQEMGQSHEDTTGDSAYERHARMNQDTDQQPIPSTIPGPPAFFSGPPPVWNQQHPPPPPPPVYEHPPPPPPPDIDMPPPPPPWVSTPPTGNVMTGTSISRAPLLYNLEKLQSKTQAELNAEVEKLDDNALELLEKQLDEEGEQAVPRTKVSGQPGFAQRYLEKFGWQKGQGLGANRDGIKTAIRVAKAKKKVGSLVKAHKGKANMGTIVAPKK